MFKRMLYVEGVTVLVIESPETGRIVKRYKTWWAPVLLCHRQNSDHGAMMAGLAVGIARCACYVTDS